MPNFKKLFIALAICLPCFVYYANPQNPNSDKDGTMPARPKGQTHRPASTNRADAGGGHNDIITLSKDEMAEFDSACLKAHNKYRALHGCPALKLNYKIAELAQNWAQSLAKRNKMEHRPNNDDYGENIYYSEGLAVNADAAVKMWYDEITLYNFDAAKFSLEAGHFTQLIWKDTKEMGVGVAKRGRKVWVVVNYEPPGNWEGEFRQNVPRKKN